MSDQLETGMNANFLGTSATKENQDYNNAFRCKEVVGSDNKMNDMPGHLEGSEEVGKISGEMVCMEEEQTSFDVPDAKKEIPTGIVQNEAEDGVQGDVKEGVENDVKEETAMCNTNREGIVPIDLGNVEKLSEAELNKPHPTVEAATNEPDENKPHPTGEPAENSPHPTCEQSKPHPTGEADESKSRPTGEPAENKPHPTGEGDESKPHPTGEVHENEPHPTGEADESMPHPTGEADESKPHPTGEVHVNKPHPTGEVHVNKPHPTGEADESKPHPTGEVHENEPHPTGEADESMPHPTGEGDESKPHPTGEVHENKPHPTGEADENKPHPTGEADESKPHPTGEADENKPHPTGEVHENKPHHTGEKQADLVKSVNREPRCVCEEVDKNLLHSSNGEEVDETFSFLTNKESAIDACSTNEESELSRTHPQPAKEISEDKKPRLPSGGDSELHSGNVEESNCKEPNPLNGNSSNRLEESDKTTEEPMDTGSLSVEEPSQEPSQSRSNDKSPVTVASPKPPKRLTRVCQYVYLPVS